MLLRIHILELFIASFVHADFLQYIPEKEKPKTIPDWDYILFSQRWPVTSCIDWKDQKEANTCEMPVDPTVWTVHGLWPTKAGTEGPTNCDSAIHFDPQQLQPFLDDLNNYWTNVEANTKPYSFWAHEWDKHGTCASILPQLNSVYNYFRKGLEFQKKYSLSDSLHENGIIPGETNYTVNDIFNAVKTALNKTPTVECDYNKKANEFLLSEIRLCFDKSLDLIDCNMTSGNPTSSCSLTKPVKYLKVTPEVIGDLGRRSDKDEYKKLLERQSVLLDAYWFLNILLWATL